MNFAGRFALVLALVLVLVLGPGLARGAAQTEVVSGNGRFVARISATPAGEPAGEIGSKTMLEVTVVERRPGEPARRMWAGRIQDELAPGLAHLDLLSDDGAALVRVIATRGRRALVREVLKGSAATALDADDLALRDAPDGSAWIDLEAGLRWRVDPGGLNCGWQLDLLGADGLVRTVELDGGALTVHRDETLALSLQVRPDISSVLYPATRELYVDSWNAPELADAGATIEIEGRGRFPSANWRFAGFEVVGDPRASGKLVLVPRGVPPSGASAQIVQPHLWTARFTGLPPGTYSLEVVGRETSDGDPRRDPAQRAPSSATLELVSPHLLAELRRASPPDLGWRSAALYDDGRVELEFRTRRQVHLVAVARWDALGARLGALATLPAAPRARASDDARDTLLWRAPSGPRRANVDAALAPSARAFADELRALADGLDPSLRPLLYVLDASSTLVARPRGGPPGSVGEVVASRVNGKLELARDDVALSSARISIAARDLHAQLAEPAARAAADAFLQLELLDAVQHPSIELLVTRLDLPRREGDGAQGFDACLGRELAVTMRGELTLRDTRRSIAWPATLSFDAQSARLRGSVALAPAEFGLPAPAANAPLPRVDVFEIRFDLVARRRER